jgi:ribosomal protein L11 methyltransferase
LSQAGWQELKVETTKAHVELLEDWFFEQGAVAVTLEDNADEPLLEPGVGETPLWEQVRLVALFTDGVDLQPVVDALPTDKITAQPSAPAHVPDQDWERAWMDNFHPMRMGERLWVCPSWIDPPDPSGVNVMLDPGLAFGTGTHPTTAMCLGELDTVIRPGDKVVDYGCGTGILAIAALKLGAELALGVDNDPQAITASHQNAERNGIDPSRFNVVMPNDDTIAGWTGAADVVVANILAGPLALLAPQLRQLLKPGGRLILAGLLENQADALMETYAPEVTLQAAKAIEGWVLLAGNAGE